MAQTADVIEVLDDGRLLTFGFEDLMRYHGPGSPGGVAHGFFVMRLAFPLLRDGAQLERRAITVRTAFGGPGARDAFELVTRAVTGGRYVVDASLARPQRGATLENFVFAITHGDRALTLAVRDGYVPDELISLARTPDRTAEQEARLKAVKQHTADIVLAAQPHDVYEVVT